MEPQPRIPFPQEYGSNPIKELFPELCKEISMTPNLSRRKHREYKCYRIPAHGAMFQSRTIRRSSRTLCAETQVSTRKQHRGTLVPATNDASVFGERTIQMRVFLTTGGRC
eukprot:gb/GECG01005272.1/.p1 GENE.gb/GECG01005272.1/~~gb/GECG01005272.1/.p1  ORF type:complete len:111 (+),score=10.39 gb/GECG01005272.1/:1-333(+)